MSDGSIKDESQISMIPVIQISINSYRPRKKFDREKIRVLADSIESNGILQPLTVRRISTVQYELISGERRLRAAVLAGLSAVPCVVIHCSQRRSAVYTLIENVQREDLTYFEQADAIKMLIDEFSFTKEQVARQIGKQQSTVADKLKLLDFSEEERQMIIRSSLTERHAKALIKIHNVKTRKKVLSKVVENGLSVGQTEEIVSKVLMPADKRKSVCSQTIIIKDLRPFFNTLNRAIQMIRKSGIDATEEKTETEHFIEYRIRIQK